jgi:two-component system cell cycle response regulator
MQVLAAEDNPVFQSMLRTMLTKWGYRAVMARDGNEAWNILESDEAPRLAVLDWMMPGLDGVEICRRIRALQRESYIYIVLLTGRTESQDLIEGMDAGADDYLTKPFNAHELRVRIRAGRRILDLQDALRKQATHDGLTGLLNRNSVLEKLSEELSRSDRHSEPVAVVMTDLDHFKSINDTHGHLAGDAVLREAARRLKAASRTYDAVGRYGGEEFLLVLPNCRSEDAWRQSERLREAICAEPFPIEGGSIDVTCSLGIACTDTVPASRLVRTADEGLYQAKGAGRNCVGILPRVETVNIILAN